MSLFDLYFSGIYLINLFLGFSVFLTNRKRALNQHYLVLSLVVTGWLTANLLTHYSSTPEFAKRYIQLATAFATFIPVSCHLLRFSILHPEDNWFQGLIRARLLITAGILAAAFCLTDVLISEVRMPMIDGAYAEVREPVYSWGYLVFSAVFIALVISLFIPFPRDRNSVEGRQRTELEFIALAYFLALATGTVGGVAVTLITHSSQTVPMANATSILVLAAIISYGIVTRRILGVATILRWVTAYTLLIIYLSAIYAAVWFGAGLALKNHPVLLNLAAALAVAFAVAPAHGKFQRVANRLISSQSMNVQATMKQASEIFQTITTSNSLLSHFTTLLSQTLHTDRIILLTRTSGEFVQQYPHPGSGDHAAIHINGTTPLIESLRASREPVCRESLGRVRKTPLVSATEEQLRELKIALAIGIFSSSGLSGLVLLGPRRTGRFYDRVEQDALQILCNQLAVALDNANLYTQVQDSKIRNDILLDQLADGVIAVHPDRKITLINREAQRITGLAASRIIGADIDALPAPLCSALEQTLTKKQELRNSDAVLTSKEAETPIRIGTVCLIGRDRNTMGALLVLTDLTEIKRLEEQVRRTDQLASVGTLAAGMAHEIKNPLVTIKTFAQLLPQRFNDDDFRETFSSLVEQEVTRIDGIVNQLLRFSKPAKPSLSLTRLHETIDQTVKLVHEQLRQKKIILNKHCNARSDLIDGDTDLLTQVFINLYLNAIDAMSEGGTLTIETSNETMGLPNGNHRADSAPTPCIKMQVSDTGSGIPEDKINHIFDPFFTSKSEGTGMGLSVAHGIIQDHHATVEVSSNLGEGTVFIIRIPLIVEE